MTKWQPIDDLPEDYRELSDSELPALARVWEEQRDLFKQSESLRVFNERLQREWAIETGIIERVYALDRGITQILIEKGIDASLIPHSATDKDPELVAQIINDHRQAIEGLFDFVKGKRALTAGYIKELHALLTRHQNTARALDSLGRDVEVNLLKGEYKSLPNNPVRANGTIHEYCPPEHVASEIDRLIALDGAHEAQGTSPEIEAAWLHHRFSQIHPFQDGNGRVARAIATLIFIKAGWFPLVVTRDERERYISALEEADAGELSKLVALFAAVQRRFFVKALSIAGEVRQREGVDQVIRAAKDLMERRRAAVPAQLEKAKDVAVSLQAFAETRFREVAEKLKTELGEYSHTYAFSVDRERAGGNRSRHYGKEILEVADYLGYLASPSIYGAWICLVLETETRCEILLSFHGVGQEYRGVLAASMSFLRREQTGSELGVVEHAAASEEVFLVNYLEDEANVRGRFARWLDQSLVIALEMWRQSYTQLS